MNDLYVFLTVLMVWWVANVWTSCTQDVTGAKEKHEH
jgi:hypothetical protein